MVRRAFRRRVQGQLSRREAGSFPEDRNAQEASHPGKHREVDRRACTTTFGWELATAGRSGFSFLQW